MLRIFEKHPHMDAYRVNGFYEPYALNAKDKRFSDAELAAEYWRARWTGLMHEGRGACLTDEHRAKIQTVERSMELPHYDEDAA